MIFELYYKVIKARDHEGYLIPYEHDPSKTVLCNDAYRG